MANKEGDIAMHILLLWATKRGARSHIQNSGQRHIYIYIYIYIYNRAKAQFVCSSTKNAKNVTMSFPAGRGDGKITCLSRERQPRKVMLENTFCT